MESAEQGGGKTTVPVYLSFKTFQSAVQSLRTHGLPNALDRSAFGSRSGAEQTQILSAFRFLGLIDEKERTKDSLRALVLLDEGSNDEKAFIGALLKERYANAVALNLEAATPQQLEKAIGDYGATGATRDRAVRFFIKAAEHAGMKLSSRLTARKARTAGTPSSNGDENRPIRVIRRGSAAVTPVTPPASTATNIKTINLPESGGTLTISGTFNYFDLDGDERTLVNEIIDKLKEFERNQKSGGDDKD